MIEEGYKGKKRRVFGPTGDAAQLGITAVDDGIEDFKGAQNRKNRFKTDPEVDAFR